MLSWLLILAAPAWADEPPRLTSLSDSKIRYEVPDKPYVILQRGDTRAVIVDNRAVNDDVLPDHRAGYSGVASLTHARRKENLFVPCEDSEPEAIAQAEQEAYNEIQPPPPYDSETVVIDVFFFWFRNI